MVKSHMVHWCLGIRTSKPCRVRATYDVMKWITVPVFMVGPHAHSANSIHRSSIRWESSDENDLHQEPTVAHGLRRWSLGARKGLRPPLSSACSLPPFPPPALAPPTHRGAAVGAAHCHLRWSRSGSSAARTASAGATVEPSDGHVPRRAAPHRAGAAARRCGGVAGAGVRRAAPA